MRHAPLLIASDEPAARVLCAALGAELLAAPREESAFEAWREHASGGEARAQVVVAAWSADLSGCAITETSFAQWLARAEAPLVGWAFALGVASARCADGGAIVAVIERPAPLDCAGFAPEASVADAACALVRSLARSEGARGVRVNAVLTSARLAPARVVAPAPPLARFPGALEREVAGAVRLLLANGASGVTGQTLAADCGRTW